MSHAFVELSWAGRPVRIEYVWVGATSEAGAHPADRPDASGATAPLVVFLHEGLGSVSMWKDFPARLCAAAGCRGLVYSRPGYGRSTPRPAAEVWDTDFMHRQAHGVLPALLQALGIDAEAQPIHLFGHSDGGSIALLFAARFTRQVAGAIVLAPHIVVEDVSVASIESAREAYVSGELKRGLARHHEDPDSPFWGWNRIWLDPRFRHWSIEEEIAAIRCPLLAVQGLDDEYGTLEQIRGIAQRAPQTRLLELERCGHSPHRDQPDRLIAVAAEFIRTTIPPTEETPP